MTDTAPLRLFVALELPADVAEALGAWGRVAAADITGLRVLPASALHVTLCFLGSCPAAATTEITAACRTVAGTGAIGLRGAQAMWLPERRPRVLAVGVEDERGGLIALQGRLATALNDAGWFELEERAFLSHCTVARVVHGRRVRRRALAPVPGLAFRASSVALMRSHLSPAGAVYEPLARVPLGSD